MDPTDGEQQVAYQHQIAFDPDYGPYLGHPMDPRTPDADEEDIEPQDAAKNAFYAGLEAKLDAFLPGTCPDKLHYPISYWLGQPHGTAAKTLFLACAESVGEHHPNTVDESNEKCARLLRTFVALMAAEYATDNVEAWQA